MKMEDFDKSPLSGNDENNNQNGAKSNGHPLERASKKPQNKSPSGQVISAAAPRKKILGERNGFSSCSNPDSPDSSSCKNPSNLNANEMGCGSVGSDTAPNYPFGVSPIDSSSSKISKSGHGDEDGENKFAPYDPLNNFLSPRPKFLRYNPNRRREILLKREKIKDLNPDNLKGCTEIEYQSDAEQGESSGSTSVSSNSSNLSSLSGGLSKGENGGDIEDNDGVETKEEEIEEEEKEDEEEDNRWNLKWVLKFLLVMLVLVMSTVYISTMNSPTPPPAVQAIRGLRDECQRVGEELLKALSDMKDFAGEGGVLFHGREDPDAGLFEVNDNNLVVDLVFAEEKAVRNEDEGGEEENAQQLDKVEVDERGTEGDPRAETEESGEEISDDMFVHGEHDVIFEKFDSVQGLQDKIGEQAATTCQDFDKFFQEEVVETEVDGISEMTEENGIIPEEIDSSNNKEPGNQEGSSEYFEEQKLDDEAKFVSDNEQDELLIGYEQRPWSRTAIISTTKDAIWVVICSLVAMGASLVLWFYYDCKRISAKTSSYSNVRTCSPETVAIPEKVILEVENASSHLVAEEAGPKRTPRRPPTPPRSHKSNSPNVKLIGELELGDFCSPVQNYNHPRSGTFIAMEKIVQKEVAKQGTGNMILSSTPVRRSMRIRNRGVTSS